MRITNTAGTGTVPVTVILPARSAAGGGARRRRRNGTFSAEVRRVARTRHRAAAAALAAKMAVASVPASPSIGCWTVLRTGTLMLATRLAQGFPARVRLAKVEG